MLNQVNLLQIHRFNPHQTQFADALVSSPVVWFRNELPPPKCEITFSYGGSLIKPEVSRYLSHSILENTEKWTQVLSLQKFSSPHRIDISNQVNQIIKLGDLFRIKRGVATGANKFFILTLAQVNKYELPENILLPILPSPRHIKAQEIQADRQGIPLLSSRLFLLNCYLPEQEIETIYPKLYHYLQTG